MACRRDPMACRMNVTDIPDESGYNWVLPPKVTLLL